jgi:hypothetical protein
MQSRWRNLLAFLLLGLITGPAMAGNNYYDAADDAVAAVNDDNYVDLSYSDFDSISLMPVSCVSYMNGHMIKFELFESTNNFQCHANNMGTFVVSISHYMRAYFNYQALVRGEDFKLPSDAGYLNCVLLQQTAYSDTKLYAKIGCLERETYTSTKLSVHVYTDKQCSVPYDDGETESTRSKKGYNINGYYFSSKVSFRPPFYSCLTCKPSEISSSFSKRGTYWYDDDAASSGNQVSKYFDDWLDDYFLQDDAYFTVQKYTNNEQVYYKEDDDDFYTVDDDGRRNLMGKKKEIKAEEGALQVFENEFWEEHDQIRKLGNNYNNDDLSSVQNWNMCKKVYKYGVWCDEDCRDLDTFRIDEWSSSDILLLFVMCAFLGSMMMLIFAKRVKAYEKASIYGDEGLENAGMSPTVLSGIFGFVFVLIIILALLKLVNETLVCAVVTCILLFTYMLKITLFETNEPSIGKKRGGNYYGGDLIS